MRYRVQGESRKLTLAGFPSLPAARRLAQEALDAAANGDDPALTKRAARNASSTAVEDVFADFMARHTKRRDGRPIRESTKLEVARLLGLKRGPDGLWVARAPRSGVLARWAGRDINSITKRDVLDALDGKVEAGAPVAANRLLSALKTAFSWCVKRDILTMSPCDHIDDPSPEVSRDRCLSDRELRAVWLAAEKIGYPYGRMVQFLLLTGQRRDEVRRAVRSEFDFAKGVWTLPAGRTKNGREHRVPLSEHAIELLQSLPRSESDAGWLFTTDAEAAVSNLARRKRRLDREMLADLRREDPNAVLPPWRLHDLRHTLKTWMQKARIPKDVRNAVQNHFEGDMDELYGHYSFDEEKRATLEDWALHLQIINTPDHANVISLRRA